MPPTAAPSEPIGMAADRMRRRCWRPSQHHLNLPRRSTNMTEALGIEIRRISIAADLVSLRGDWNALARGVPFRSFEWLDSWWRFYGVGPGKELFVLAAFDPNGALVGVAPWYLERRVSRAVIRFLGSGEVCSDYLTILCRPGQEDRVTAALADWLCAEPCLAHEDACWEMLELSGVDAHDATVIRLLEHLAARGKLVHRTNRSSCWRIHLPADWEGYLATLSKSHRKQIRRLERKYFRTRRARLQVVETAGELVRGWDMLAQLHQRRRQSLGDRGCFASTRFATFHQETARRLLESGNLRLVCLDVDGRTVAAEYQVLGDGVVYAYQSGIDPAALEHEPGRLITLATLKQAVAEGRQAFDFLRGDELYKAHWRAQPRATQDIRVMSNTAGARLRHNLWLAGGNLKSWIKKRLDLSRAATW
jgi:CelD/BcsL family acetyltransferase involved in cellulose biosynthesis